MEMNIRDNLKMATNQGLGSYKRNQEVNTLDSGKITKNQDLEFSNPMEANMKDNERITKNQDLEFTNPME